MMNPAAFKPAFICLLLFCSFIAPAQRTARPTPDTLWIQETIVVDAAEKADRYILKDTFLNGQYIMKGFYTNGQPFKDGYAKAKRKNGRGYANGKTTWYKKDGSITMVQEYREDSAWGKDGEGRLKYMADGVFHTDYYDNGKPARRYAEKIRDLFRNTNEDHDKILLKAAADGLFASITGPEIEMYYDNGRQALVMDMKKKKWISYYENGTKATELLPKEKGYLLKKYFRNGKPAAEETLDDKFHVDGPYTYYYSDGVLREKSSKKAGWSGDTYTEPVYEYYPNGKLYKKTIYGTGGGSKVVMESPVQDIGEKPEPPKKQPEPYKNPNPDAYTYFDIQGKQTYSYTENDKTPEGLFDYMRKQVSILLEEKLTAEEKKYPAIDRREIRATGSRNEMDTRYTLNDTVLNGKYIQRTGREIRIYTFADGKLDNRKTYITFDEDYGIYRSDLGFIGLRYNSDMLLMGAHYDDETKTFVEENKITGTITETGFKYWLEKKESGNRKAPHLYYHIVPQVKQVLRSPTGYLWRDILPSFKIKYTNGQMKEYETIVRQVDEYMDRDNRYD